MLLREWPLWGTDAIGYFSIIFAICWGLYFAIFALGGLIFQRRIDRLQESWTFEERSKRILLFRSLDNWAPSTMIIPMAASIVPIFPLLILNPDNVSSSEFNQILGVFAIFLGLGFIGQAGYLYSLFFRTIEASDEGICSLRLKGQGATTRSFIGWAEVTRVDISIFYERSMIIDGVNKRIAVPRYLENLEALFRIMRKKVPRAALSDVVFDYILERSQGDTPPSDEKTRAFQTLSSTNSSIISEPYRMNYATFYKVYCIALSVFVLALLWGYFYSIVLANFFSIFGLFVSFFTLLPVLLVMEVYLAYYLIGKEGIEHHSMYWGRIFIPWNEVESISFETGRQGSIFRVIGAKKKIALVCYVNGLPEFARMVMANLPPEKWIKARLELTKYAKK